MELLGLAPDEPVTHDRLRRAYLRRLKTCSPERDPEGFQRLREAFEAVEAYARMHDAMVAAHDRAAFAQAASAPIATRIEVMEPRVARGPEPTIEPAADAHDEQRDDVLEQLLDRIDDEPDDTDDTDDADDPGESAEHGDPAGAAPSLDGVSAEILALLERDQVDAALDLRDRWNRSALDDHRAVSPRVVLRWALTRELLEIAVALPTALRTALAKAIAAGELSLAHGEVNIYQAIHPERSRDVARHMARRAPNLYKVFGSGLQRGAERFENGRQQTGGRSLAWSIWILIAVGSALVRAGSCTQSSPRDMYRNPSSEIQLDPATVERLRTRLEGTPPAFNENGLKNPPPWPSEAPGAPPAVVPPATQPPSTRP
jgi:hypothetical protein